MYELGFPHDGVEQRSTLTTVCIMRRLFSINKQPISTVRNSQLAAFNSRERFERCTGRAATI